MTYIKIKEVEYPAIISGHMIDKEWDNRESKSILITMSYADALSIFVDDTPWFIIVESEENGEIERHEYDNSDYCLAGDITDNRDGTLTIKMGKYTDLELALLAAL